MTEEKRQKVIKGLLEFLKFGEDSLSTEEKMNIILKENGVTDEALEAGAKRFKKQVDDARDKLHSEECRKKYLEGYKTGLKQFAWWKDGVQYVGTCGTTLQQALTQVDDLEKLRQQKG